MFKYLWSVVLLGMASVTLAAITVEDDLGNVLALQKPAQRIVALAPHIVENLYAVGAGEQIVGTVHYADFPEAAQAITRVGSYNAVNFEAVLALQPDLVIAWDSGNSPASIAKLRALGLNVYVSEPRELNDVANALHRYAQLAGTGEVGLQVAQAFKQRAESLRLKYAARPAVSVFYQVWHHPLQTLNAEHLVSRVIALCGGQNVFADAPTLAPRISVETVLKRDPQAIVASGMGEARPDWLDKWLDWPQLQAVKNGHLFFVPPDLIQRHSVRILDGADLMCEALEQVRAHRAIGTIAE